jgi:hypothetical protein
MRDGTDEKPFSVTSVKPHHTPVDLRNQFMSDVNEVLHSMLLVSRPIDFPFCSAKSENNTMFQIVLTEVLTPKDLRRFGPRFRVTKEKEIEGLTSRGTWRVVCADDLPDNANVMVGRFILSEYIFKAIFVVQGHKDSQNLSLLHKATTLHIRFIRLLLCLESTVKFRVGLQISLRHTYNLPKNCLEMYLLDPHLNLNSPLMNSSS